MALVVLSKPGAPLLDALGLGVEGRSRFQDRFVVDLGDGGGISVAGRPNSAAVIDAGVGRARYDGFSGRPWRGS